MDNVCLQNIKNKDLAIKLNVTSQCVSQWISGKRQPKIEQLPIIASTLNCTVEYLIKALIKTKERHKKRVK